MSKKDKLISRLKSKPRDFTFDEAEALLLSLGFIKCKTGKTGGSRVRYEKDGIPFFIHQPHPRNVLKPYAINKIINRLRRENLI